MMMQSVMMRDSVVHDQVLNTKLGWEEVRRLRHSHGGS